MHRCYVCQKRSKRHTGDATEEDTKELEKVTIRLPQRYLEALDLLVQADDFPSRSEAIRAAVRDMIYARVDLVTDKLKKIAETQRSLVELEELKKKFLSK
jgi:Arc/MetJ-type ribon-helix-helix transcriptional regulator